MLKLVIFDMDGLMFDTERVLCRAFMEVGEAWGLPVREAHYLACLGMNSWDERKKYEEFFGADVDVAGLQTAMIARGKQIFREEGIPVKRGLRELLDVLKDRGIHTAVASGSDREVIESHLARTGLSDLYDRILSSKEVAHGKPEPDIFLALCEEFGVRPEEALVLEDSDNGVMAAVAGNIPVINVPDMISLPEGLQEACLAVVPDLGAVIPYIESL